MRALMQDEAVAVEQPLHVVKVVPSQLQLGTFLVSLELEEAEPRALRPLHDVTRKIV